MADILTSTHLIRTRKAHICEGCGKELPRGSECFSISMANRGCAYTFYECEDCWEYFNENCIGCESCDVCIGLSYEVGAIEECKRDRKR